MSPILVRPVREQLEHDRVIRLLQLRLKRRADVAINIGEQQTVPVRIGQVQIFPDLVLTSPDRGRKLVGTVEVETAESVNHLEAMAQWAHLGRARVPFHLYVPAGSVDIAKRLATENHVNVAEIWSYHTIGDQTRFTLVHRAAPSQEPKRAPVSAPQRPQQVAGTPASTPPRTQHAAGTQASAPPRAQRAARTSTDGPKPAAASAVVRKVTKRTTDEPARAKTAAKAARGSRAKAPARKASRTQKRK